MSAAETDEAAFARRLPVWTALAELFVDSDPDDVDHARIARTARAAGYSAAELRAILDDEVAPVFSTNLLVAVGEWQPWSQDDVRRLMGGWRLGQRPFFLGRWIRRWLLGRYLDEQWAAIERHLRDDPPLARDRA